MIEDLTNQRLCVLLSGGVDSAVATHLLWQAGYRPDLFYIRIGMDDGQFSCTAEEDIEMCRAISRRYQLPLEVIDLQQEYWDSVVTYTIDRVRRGLTPNPDVMCNRLIKFGAFEQKVGKNYDRIATGHYAAIVAHGIGAPSDEFATGRWLATAADPVKDQTDFLAQIDTLQLAKLVLPLGALPKEEVRRIAIDALLPPAKRKDSQGICFLGKINYNDFVRRFLGEQPGDVVDIETGQRIGKHKGYWFHTIGQRKGLGLGGGPWFVVRKDTATNTLYVSRGYDTRLQYGRTFRLADFHFITHNPWADHKAVEITFKIRHTDRFAHGTLTRLPDNSFSITSLSDIQGIAPGQFGVVYDKTHTICVGSGEIAGA